MNSIDRNFNTLNAKTINNSTLNNSTINTSTLNTLTLNTSTLNSSMINISMINASMINAPTINTSTINISNIIISSLNDILTINGIPLFYTIPLNNQRIFNVDDTDVANSNCSGLITVQGKLATLNIFPLTATFDGSSNRYFFGISPGIPIIPEGLIPKNYSYLSQLNYFDDIQIKWGFSATNIQTIEINTVSGSNFTGTKTFVGLSFTWTF